jgi:hypothetical protein
VELHVCDHSTKSDQTIAVMTLEVEGDSLRFSLNGYSDSKMCSAGEDHKAEMAAHIACRLYAYMTAPSQMVFRQPSTETRKALDEN